ncbi:uncharacterized protein LOC109598895 [Aethina tumida]|uniref:uncharacterized protein LOC109598895 n=1 Tax=Aethina tumida TaxID=116153 RepID=UPI00096B19BB|nr:uncharacterized protein LOC109598895 [Aethina tumida]
MRFTCALVIVFAIAAAAADEDDSSGVRIALKIYDDCSKSEGFSPCLKKKAVTALDRLARADKLNVADGVTIVKSQDVTSQDTVLTEEQLEASLPRALDAKEDALNDLIIDKVTKFVSSRSIEVTLPKISPEELLEEGRGKKMKGMMGGMMMGVAAKMAAMVPIAIAGLFLLAGKALITAKIALLLSGIIALKKLFSQKGGGGGGGGGHSGGWQSGGGGGGWQSSGGGGGWDKRSLNAQNLVYKAYLPK